MTGVTKEIANKKAKTIDEKIGAIIRARRQELGLTQSGLAKLIEVTFQQVQKYENGSNSLSAPRLVQMAQALRMSVATFFCDFPAREFHASDREALEVMKAFNAIESYTKRKAFADLLRAII